MKEIREEPNKWRYFMYIDRKTQYCQDVSSLQFDLKIHCKSQSKSQ